MTTTEVSVHKPEDLTWLINELQPEIIRNITHLLICLNCPLRTDGTSAGSSLKFATPDGSSSPLSAKEQASGAFDCSCAKCPRSNGRGFDCFCPCLPQDNPPLDSESQQGHKLLYEWRKLVEVIAANVDDRQLRLVLFCDTINRRTAEEVVEPLLAAFANSHGPRLNQCTLRLGAQRDDELTAIARSVSDELTGKAILTKSVMSPDWFNSKLPTEILLNILDKVFLTDKLNEGVDLYRAFNGRWINVTRDQYMCCKSCNNHKYRYIKCCCFKQTASYSPTCVCLAPVQAPLMVNKRLRNIGLQIYCREKALFEVPFGKETLNYLRQIPPSLLPYIRHLRFVFDCSCFEEWRQQSADSAALQAQQLKAHLGDIRDSLILRDASHWPEILSFILENFDVPRLTIRIYTTNEAKMYCSCLEEEHEEHQGQNAFVTTSLQDAVMAYWGTMKAFQKQISGLRCLEFENIWWSKLGSLMARKVLGDKYSHTRKHLLSSGSSADGPRSSAASSRAVRWNAVNDETVPRWWYEHEDDEDEAEQPQHKRRRLSDDSD